MARREYDYIKGNTVLAPERKRRIVHKPERKYKQIQRRKLNKDIFEKNKRKNDRKYLLTVAGVIIALGFMTIYGDGKVYNMEKNLSDLNTQINKTQEENEALQVKLIKFSSLDNIEQNAKSKLSMYVPSKKETTTIDFSKNYFQDIKPKSYENNTKDERGLFSKILSFIK